MNSSTTSLFDRFRTLVRELRAANGANVTITFALATIPMIGFVGAAVDYSHANSVRAAMQAAVDSTALMLSKQAAGLNQSDIQPKAEAYFKALLNRPEANGVTVATPGYDPAVSKILVTAKANVKTNFMGLFNVLFGVDFSQMNIGVESVAMWGSSRLRIALALDTTGSMASDGKMEALKTATKALLDQLKAAGAQPGDVYVSIIPFSKDVNVGSANYKATWIDWTDWENANGSCSKKDWWVKTKTDCLSQNGNPQWTPDNPNTWNGCDGPRQLERAAHRQLRHQRHAAVHRHRCHAVCSGAVRQLLAEGDALELRLDRDEESRGQLLSQRQHQPGHRPGARVDVAGRRRPLSHPTGRTGGLQIPEDHHPDERRSEHPKSLVQRRRLVQQRRRQDRRAAEADVRQRQRRRHHALHDPRQYRWGSAIHPAEELRG
jgi:Flp pilus assembly protein TadG